MIIIIMLMYIAISLFCYSVPFEMHGVLAMQILLLNRTSEKRQNEMLRLNWAKQTPGIMRGH